jgi:peroxiredoxin
MRICRAFIITLLLLPFTLHAADEFYFIDSVVDSINLVINGNQFAAKGFCHDFQFGDQVIFLSGDPDGTCTEALLMNQRTNETCNVWCQYPL